MASMSGELSHYYHENDNGMRNAFHPSPLDIASDIDASFDDLLEGVAMPDQLWQTPTFETFADATSVRASLEAASPHIQSTDVDPAILCGSYDTDALTLKAPPVQVGSQYPAPAQSRKASSGSNNPMNAFGDLETPRTGTFPKVGPLEEYARQSDTTNEFEQHLTEGLTASPEWRHVLLDMSAFAQGDVAATGDESVADATQYQQDNPFIAMPSGDQSVVPFRNEDLMGVSDLQPAFDLGVSDLDDAGLDSLNYNYPNEQNVNSMVKVRNSTPASQLPSRLLSLPELGACARDAMQETFMAPMAYIGPAQQQPQPVRLQPAGEFRVAIPRADFAFPALQQTPLSEKPGLSIKVSKPAVAKGRVRPTQPLPAGFKKEQAKLSRRKNWVRINDRSGANNRGGKLNQYDPTEHYVKVLIPPSWTAAGHSFVYNEDGELEEPCYSAEQLDAYLRFHDGIRARQGRGKLRVWIQKTPADCARRYANPSSAECKFKDCPLRQLGKRATIWQGHLRVAFDENYDTYGKGLSSGEGGSQCVDPFANAGYCHLYCFERFLDLPSLLDAVTIKLDSRVIDSEPNGNYPCRLGPNDQQDGRHKAAVNFMAQTHKGRLIRFPPQYPQHTASSSETNGGNASKPHNLTLNGVMQRAYVDCWAAPKLRTMQARNASATLLHTLGDLELFCAAKWPERCRALKEGADPRKAKDRPQYERGTRGYRKEAARIAQKEREKKRKRARSEYETDTEEEMEQEEDTENVCDEESGPGSDVESTIEQPARKERIRGSSARVKKRARRSETVSSEQRPTSHAKSKAVARQAANRDDETSDEGGLIVSEKPRRSARKAAKRVAYDETSDADDF